MQFEFEKLLSLAAKDSYFIFDETFYKHCGVLIGSLLGLILSNAFLLYDETKWLERFPLEYRLFYCQRYVGNKFF